MHLFGGSNHTFGNHVALHNSAKNIDQDGFEFGIFEHDFERFGDFLSRRTAAHVQEVCRLAAVEFNRVHGRHRQARAIDQAANIAIQ